MASEFADQRSDLLNRTVCNGIRITPVLTETGQCRVAYGITKNDWVPSRLIPLTLGRAAPRAYVRLFHSLQWDPEQQFLADGRSYIGLYAHDDIEDDGACLIRYDYNRDIKVNANDQGYPRAHVHVFGRNPAHDALSERCPDLTEEPHHLHYPVGGRRYRPTLEDIIEFTIVEGIADAWDGWQDAIVQYRSVWRDLQLRAAVRRDPNPAAETLASLGWTVAAPQ